LDSAIFLEKSLEGAAPRPSIEPNGDLVNWFSYRRLENVEKSSRFVFLVNWHQARVHFGHEMLWNQWQRFDEVFWLAVSNLTLHVCEQDFRGLSPPIENPILTLSLLIQESMIFLPRGMLCSTLIEIPNQMFRITLSR
jgi:hypothetical protein